jgi:hypothetical protein
VVHELPELLAELGVSDSLFRKHQSPAQRFPQGAGYAMLEASDKVTPSAVPFHPSHGSSWSYD